MEETIDTTQARQVLERLKAGGASELSPEEMLVPLLQDLQHAYGYLPREILEYVSDSTGVPLSRMYGVITFYTQFYLEKRGRHIVRCCEGTACHVKGAPAIADSIERELEIGAGETSSDGEFTFETVNCLGACALAPLVVVDEEYHGKMNQDQMKKILKQVKES